MSHYFYITPEEYAEASENGVSPRTLDRRVRDLGWPKSKAMATPTRKLIDRKKWAQIAEQNGVSYGTFMSRIHHQGWDPEKAATKALETHEERKLLAAAGMEKARKIPSQYIQLAKENGIPYPTFHFRVKSGWDLDRAATHPVMTPTEKGQLGASHIRQRYGDVNSIIFQKKENE